MIVLLQHATGGPPQAFQEEDAERLLKTPRWVRWVEPTPKVAPEPVKVAEKVGTSAQAPTSAPPLKVPEAPVSKPAPSKFGEDEDD